MITQEDIKKDYVTAKQACEMLNISLSRLSRLCLAGRFEGAFKAGGSWLIPRIAVENFKRLAPGVKPPGYNEKKLLEQALQEAANLKKGDNNDKQ